MSVAQQREDGRGGIDLTTPVRAINRSDTEQVWMYDRVKHVLPPNQQVFIPYMAMCLWRGDPRSIDLPGGRPHEQYRRLERERLEVMLGIYENTERWDLVPQVDCYPIDSDVPFATVVADPDGNSLSTDKRTNNELDFLRAELEKQAGMMRVLQQQVAVRESQAQSAEAAGFDPEDLDYQATTTRAITPEEATGNSMVAPSPVKKSSSKVVKKRPAPGDGPQVTKDGE